MLRCSRAPLPGLSGLPHGKINKSVILHGFDGVRRHAPAKDDNILTSPSGGWNNYTGEFQEMGNLGDILAPRILGLPFLESQLPESAHLDTQGLEGARRGKVENGIQLKVKFIKPVAHLGRNDRLPALQVKQDFGNGAVPVPGCVKDIECAVIPAPSRCPALAGISAVPDDAPDQSRNGNRLYRLQRINKPDITWTALHLSKVHVCVKPVQDAKDFYRFSLMDQVYGPLAIQLRMAGV